MRNVSNIEAKTPRNGSVYLNKTIRNLPDCLAVNYEFMYNVSTCDSIITEFE